MFKIAYLFLLVSVLGIAAPKNPGGRSIRLNPERLKFAYWNNDGDIVLNCSHRLVDDFGLDWEVICPMPDSPIKKIYRVHLKATQYERRATPQQTLEILYWIADRSVRQKTQNGAISIWLNSTGDGKFHSVTLSQAVENDVASLVLEILPD